MGQFQFIKASKVIATATFFSFLDMQNAKEVIADAVFHSTPDRGYDNNSCICEQLKDSYNGETFNHWVNGIEYAIQDDEELETKFILLGGTVKFIP